MKHVVLEAIGLSRGSFAPALQATLRRHPSVLHVEANPVRETVSIGYDEEMLSEADLQQWIEKCGYHCRGEVVPAHVCAPDPEPGRAPAPEAHIEHTRQASEEAPTSAAMEHVAHEMGHGAGMTMAEMVRDMRRRFYVTFVLAIAVTLYSPLGTDVFGLRLRAPVGLSNDLLMFLLATPAVLWGGQMFFVGAYRALSRRTLDMSVLVSVSVGAGYLFSIATTFLFEGEVFYEAAVVLLAFILFGHWMEMRARAGASNAMRARSISHHRRQL